MPDADLAAIVTRLRSVNQDLTQHRNHKVVDDDTKWDALTIHTHTLEAIGNDLEKLGQH